VELVTPRWTYWRKAALLRTLEADPSILPDVLAAYKISPEEFELWRAAYARGGAKALRVTRIERPPRLPRTSRGRQRR
jgi:Protein of unknown function (DUF1153)